MVPSIQESFQRGRETWKATRSALGCTQGASQLPPPTCPILSAESVGLVVHPEHPAGNQVPQGHPPPTPELHRSLPC